MKGKTICCSTKPEKAARQGYIEEIDPGAGVRVSWRHRSGRLTRLRKKGRGSLHAWLVPEGSATIPILTGVSP